MTTCPRLRGQARLQWDPVRQRQAVLTPEGVIFLNTTGADILVLCDGQHSIAAIVAELSAKYRNACVSDIQVFLERLMRKSVVECNDEHDQE